MNSADTHLFSQPFSCSLRDAFVNEDLDFLKALTTFWKRVCKFAHMVAFNRWKLYANTQASVPAPGFQLPAQASALASKLSAQASAPGSQLPAQASAPGSQLPAQASAPGSQLPDKPQPASVQTAVIQPPAQPVKLQPLPTPHIQHSRI